jgi:hypothetical protein
MRKTRVFALGGLLAIATAASAVAAPGTETGPSSSEPPYLLPSKPGVVTKSILTTGDSVGGYRMVGIPDGLGAYDNGDGTFTVLMNHELPSDTGAVRAHGARGAFVSRWTIDKSDLSVLSGEDQIQTLNVWDPSLNAGAGDWKVVNTDPEARINRLCSADLAPISAFYNPATGNGYDGRIFTDGEEGGDQGRPFAHVVDTGESFDVSPWVGNMSFENVVANPATGDTTAVMGLDDGSSAVDQQVYLHLGTKTDTGNPVEKAGLANGKLWGVKVPGVPLYERDKSDWEVGDKFEFELADVSQFAGVGGKTDDGTVNTLDEDSHAQGVTSFQRPEDGAWDPNNPSDFYFVTTSSFGPGSTSTGETRLWRLRFDDVTDPSKGGELELLVSGPIGTPDSGDGTQSAGSPGPQMLDNITVNKRGQVIMQEDTGNQAYLAGVWIYNIRSGSLVKVAQADPDVFTPGGPGFVTKDEESSGVIPAPFLGAGAYLLDEQVHAESSDPELVQGGQLMKLRIPPGKFK